VANRYGKQFGYTLEQDVYSLYGRFVVGSTGAVGTGTVKGGGVSGITRSSTGLYVITLSDKWNCMLEFNAWIVSASGNSGVAKVEPLNATPGNFQSDFRANGSFSVLCLDYAGAAVDPASTDIFYFKVALRNSSVNPFGFVA
jgi:hypothetical protein